MIFNDVQALTEANLKEGRTVHCTRYYSGGELVGGLEYYIKTSAQASADGDVADGYINHTLDNGNVAVLSTENGRVSVRSAGAKGDGINDDSACIKAWLQSFGELYAPAGDYIIDFQGADTDGVFVNLTKSIDVSCAGAAKFIAKNSLDGDMIRLEVPNSGPVESDVNVKWVGGIFDQREQANSTSVPFSANYAPVNLGTSATTDGLSIIGIYDDGSSLAQGVQKCVIENVTFIATDDKWESAGGDSGLNLASADDTVVGCTFIGNRDLGIYHSSDDDSGTGLGLGQSFTATGNTFKDCMFGVSSKRGADNISIYGNTFKDCMQWIAIEPFGRRAQSVSITGNVGSGYIWAIDVGSTDGTSITGNVMRNAGVLLEGGTTPSVNFTNPNAIALKGCIDTSVVGNTISNKIPEYSALSCEAIVLESQDLGSGEVDTDESLITGNMIKGIDVPYFSASTLNNTFELNKVTGSSNQDFDMAVVKLRQYDSGELTISSGAITVTGSAHSVDTEADNATDDLDTINGGVDRMRLLLKAQNSTKTVIIKDASGNIATAGDFQLTNQADWIELIYDKNTSFWYELSRSDNGA